MKCYSRAAWLTSGLLTDNIAVLNPLVGAFAIGESFLLSFLLYYADNDI